jgi:hypothetical protein
LWNALSNHFSDSSWIGQRRDDRQREVQEGERQARPDAQEPAAAEGEVHP